MTTAEISVTVHVLDVAQLRDAARALAAHGLRVHYHARRRDGGRVCGSISPALLPALARVGGCRVQLS